MKAAWTRLKLGLIGDDPHLRLMLSFALAMGCVSWGSLCIMLSMLGGFFHLVAYLSGDEFKPLTPTVWTIFNRGLELFLVGTAAASVIHAVARLYEKRDESKPPAQEGEK